MQVDNLCMCLECKSVIVLALCFSVITEVHVNDRQTKNYTKSVVKFPYFLLKILYVWIWNIETDFLLEISSLAIGHKIFKFQASSASF